MSAKFPINIDQEDRAIVRAAIKGAGIAEDPEALRKFETASQSRCLGHVLFKVNNLDKDGPISAIARYAATLAGHSGLEVSSYEAGYLEELFMNRSALAKAEGIRQTRIEPILAKIRHVQLQFMSLALGGAIRPPSHT
jgi:hypothetical protein